MKLKIAFICTLLLWSAAYTSFAQEEKNVLVTIGNESVTKDEFLKTYSKNNNLTTATEKDLREYLELFINFKMKVKEGEALQLDTLKQFKTELLSYQKQSSQQYLIDKEVTEQLMNEAKARAKYHVRASHILINCPENASPKDTMAAYKKALTIREEILSSLYTFADAAVKFSEDPSARDMTNPQNGRVHPGNQGDLGYFTVLDLIYPFETAAYNTPIGQISMPIRSQFGYHLVYVTDIIQAIKSISIGQIFVSDTLAADHQMSDSSRIKLSLIQAELKAGTPFETVAARYSDDAVSKDKGGQVEPFAPNRRTGDFVKAVLTLPAGKVSEPIATNYGWHIVQLIAVSYVNIDDDMEYSLRNRISRDSRSFKSKSSFITKIKKEYNYNEAGKTKAIKFILKNMPEEFFQSKTVKLDELKGIEKLQPMATYADQTITAIDFAKYINRFKGMQLKKEEIESFINERFDMYVQDNMMRYENDHILEKYPELRELVKEFHDGMVLYEINTQNVWGKAVSDTVGLEQFYQSNLSKYTDPTTLEISKLNNIKAIVITDYQEYLDQKWLAELRKKYNPRINEALFSTLLKN